MNRILIVDNDETIQMLYADELTDEGYDVFTIGDCAQVISAIQENQPDLILMETRLGKYDGLDLLQDIRNRNHELPVILCTAYPTSKYDPKSEAADFHVVKSSSLKELKCRIKMVLRGGDPYHGGTTLNGSHQTVNRC